jgi:hypothetical protein
MAPKHHPTPLSGGDRKAFKKELSKSRAMTRVLPIGRRKPRRLAINAQGGQGMFEPS